MSETGLRLRPIGRIRSPHRDPHTTPIQPVYASGIPGSVEVFPEYQAGLQDLEGFSHIYLLYIFDRAGAVRLTVKPYLQDRERGVFATRAPVRPNHVGLSIVRLVKRVGCILHIEDVDVLDDTPLLDIKPYSSRFDVRDSVRNGWQEEVDEETARRRGRQPRRGVRRPGPPTRPIV